MSNSSTYVGDHGGHQYAITFIQRQNGIAIRVQAGPLPAKSYDKLYPTYNEAQNAGIAEAQRLLSKLAG